MFFKIGFLKHFTIFTGKHPCWSLFSIKLQAWRSGCFCSCLVWGVYPLYIFSSFLLPLSKLETGTRIVFNFDKMKIQHNLLTFSKSCLQLIANFQRSKIWYIENNLDLVPILPNYVKHSQEIFHMTYPLAG